MNSGASTVEARVDRIRFKAMAETPPLATSREPTNAVRIVGSTAFAGVMTTIALVLVLSMLGTSPAFADGDGTSGQSHAGGGCNSQYKVGHRDSDCLHGWWDNTPPASTGVSGGSTYGTQNECSEYGDIKSHVDMLNTNDMHFHNDDGGKKRGRRGYNDVSGISCCINESDLCYKQQVKKKQGNILVWSGDDTDMDEVNVISHTRRYLYCNQYPDSIYCENDLDGDAFIAPSLLCGPHGNKRECRASDCTWVFNHAENDAVGNHCTIDSVSYADGFCTFDASCGSAPVSEPIRFVNRQTGFEIYLQHVRTRLGVCGSSQGWYLFNEVNDDCI